MEPLLLTGRLTYIAADVIPAIVVRATVNVDDTVMAPVGRPHNYHSAAVTGSKIEPSIRAPLNIHDVMPARVTRTRGC